SEPCIPLDNPSTCLTCSYLLSAIFVYQLLQPPQPPLFPYTTLFRSLLEEMPAIPVLIGSSLTQYNNSKVTGWPTEENMYVYPMRSEEHTSELQSRFELVCRLLLEKINTTLLHYHIHNDYHDKPHIVV